MEYTEEVYRLRELFSFRSALQWKILLIKVCPHRCFMFVCPKRDSIAVHLSSWTTCEKKNHSHSKLTKSSEEDLS